MPIDTTQGEIFTIKKITDYLNVTERTIYRLATEKQLPIYKLGANLQFSRQDVDRWIKKQPHVFLALDGGKNGAL